MKTANVESVISPNQCLPYEAPQEWVIDEITRTVRTALFIVVYKSAKYDLCVCVCACLPMGR